MQKKLLLIFSVLFIIPVILSISVVNVKNSNNRTQENLSSFTVKVCKLFEENRFSDLEEFVANTPDSYIAANKRFFELNMSKEEYEEFVREPDNKSFTIEPFPKFTDKKDLVSHVFLPEISNSQNSKFSKIVSIKEKGDEGKVLVLFKSNNSSEQTYEILTHFDGKEWKVFKFGFPFKSDKFYAETW